MVNLMELTTRAAFLAPTKPVKRSIESKAMGKKKKGRKNRGKEKRKEKRRGRARKREKRRKWTDASLPVEPSWQRTN